MSLVLVNLSTPSIVEGATEPEGVVDSPRGEVPPPAPVPDTRTIFEVCEDILKLAEKMRREDKS